MPTPDPHPAAPRAPITGVILAGGQGSRMGGVDKGLVPLRGRPMVDWVIERLRPQVDALLINANQNTERYAAFGHPVFPDDIAGFAGPLAGLHAALARATTPLVATAPCDSPFLPTDLVSRLHAALIADDAQLAVAHTFAQAHPVFCLCRRDVLPHLADFLAGGGRKIDRWYASLRVVAVQFDDQEEAFRNINTRDELRDADGT
ncbi:MAG: molybdenum cofactor guanylyltransferase MobA [Rhodocyclaceae bacterium]